MNEERNNQIVMLHIPHTEIQKEKRNKNMTEMLCNLTRQAKQIRKMNEKSLGIGMLRGTFPKNVGVQSHQEPHPSDVQYCTIRQ